MSYLVYGNGRHGAQLVAFVRGQANPHSKTWARIEAALSRLQKQQQAARPEEGAPIPQKGRAGHPAFSCIPAWELDENAKRAEVAAFFEESGFTAEDLRAFTGIAPEVLRSYIAGEAVPWQARLAILVEAGFAAPFEEVWEYTSAERREQALRLLPAAGF